MFGSRLRHGLYLAVVALILAIISSWAMVPTSAAAEPQPNARAFARVMAVQDRNTARLMSIQGVVGTATGLNAAGRPVVKVYVVQAGVRGIPGRLEGEPVAVEVTGPLFAVPNPKRPPKPPQPPSIDPTSRFESPVPIGVSTGNEFHWSAGTIGCRVIDAFGAYALSNVHVFDPWHYGVGPYDGVALGERIVQPGRIDDPADDPSGAATPENIIGKLVASVPIDFQGGDVLYEGEENLVDAAIAIVPMESDDYPEPFDLRTLGNSTPADGYGKPVSVPLSAYVGLPVQKYGRTTALTRGTVTAVNATVDVGYSSGTARFVDQIIVGGRKFIKAGDSGSLLVTDPEKDPVGLLFAGNTPGSVAIANDIDLVLLAFGVVIDGQ